MSYEDKLRKLRERYAVLKLDPEFMAAKRKKDKLARERHRERRAFVYREWAKKHRKERNLAEQRRRRKMAHFGVKTAISEYRRGGGYQELIARLKLAIAKID